MKALLVLLAATVSMLAVPARGEDAATQTKGPVYHVVAFKFKPDAKPEQIKNVEQAFAELKSKIPLIQTLHWGTNISKEQRDKGYTHCWVLTFASAKDRDAYLVDPAHKAFGELAGPVIGDVLVIDFESQP